MNSSLFVHSTVVFSSLSLAALLTRNCCYMLDKICWSSDLWP